MAGKLFYNCHFDCFVLVLIMAVFIQFLLCLLMAPMLEDVTEDFLTMQDPYSTVEIANPLVVFIIEVLFVILLVDCFCLCIFTFWDHFKDEDKPEQGNTFNKPDPAGFVEEYENREESDISKLSVSTYGTESSSIWLGKLEDITKQRKGMVFVKKPKKSHKTVLVPNRQKINLFVILRRKYSFKKKVPVYSAVRYTSLNEILLSGSCVEINDSYISVTDFEQECSTSQVKEKEEIDFENAVKIAYAPTKKKPQVEEVLNVSIKKT